MYCRVGLGHLWKRVYINMSRFLYLSFLTPDGEYTVVYLYQNVYLFFPKNRLLKITLLEMKVRKYYVITI